MSDDDHDWERHQHPSYEDQEAYLTRREKKALLEMLESHKRAVWLWSAIGVWAKWITAVAAAAAALKLGLGDAIRGLLK